MSMFIRLSKSIASFFVRLEIIKSEDVQVYEYGLQLLLSTIANGVIALVISIISKTFLPCLCFLGIFVLMRAVVGGYHAKSHLGCCGILILVLTVFILILKLVPSDYYYVLSAIMTVLSVVIILKYAPVEHENKPITEKDRKRLRQKSIIYSAAATILIILFAVLKFKVAMLSTAYGIFTVGSWAFIAVMLKKPGSFVS